MLKKIREPSIYMHLQQYELLTPFKTGKVQIINSNIMVAKGSPVVLQQSTSVKCDTSGEWDLIFPRENIKAGEKKRMTSAWAE